MNGLTIELGVLISLCGLIIALIGLQINRDKQARDKKKEIQTEASGEAAQSVKTQMQLDYISKGVDSIRLEIKDVRLEMRANEQKVQADMQVMSERVTRLEESQKSMHKRLNTMEGIKND